MYICTHAQTCVSYALDALARGSYTFNNISSCSNASLAGFARRVLEFMIHVIISVEQRFMCSYPYRVPMWAARVSCPAEQDMKIEFT